jgi:CYTH domain-containing protein
MGVAKLTDQNTVIPEQSKYARVERERKFLLDSLPEGLTPASPHVQITDNYITGTRLRLRKIRDPQANKWTLKLTQKFALNKSDLSRTILTNVYLNATEYNTLAVFEANEIRKNRYSFENAGNKYGIDLFLGDLLGLILAEISFESDEELEQFERPAFAFAEVTNSEMFTGAKLVDLTFEDIRNEVARTNPHRVNQNASV